MLALAAVFGWRELELQGVLVAVAVAGAATVFSAQRLDGVARWLAPALLSVTTAVNATAWLALKTPILLLGVALPVLGAAWVAMRLPGARPPVPAPVARELPLRVPEFLTWQTLGLGTMALVGGAYFHLLTLGVDDIGRRLVLTLAWTLLGLAGVGLGRRLHDTAPRDAGFVVLAAAVLKATLYDTTHLFGGLRIVVLVAVGALLLVGGSVIGRRERGAQE